MFVRSYKFKMPTFDTSMYLIYVTGRWRTVQNNKSQCQWPRQLPPPRQLWLFRAALPFQECPASFALSGTPSKEEPRITRRCQIWPSLIQSPEDLTQHQRRVLHFTRPWNNRLIMYDSSMHAQGSVGKGGCYWLLSYQLSVLALYKSVMVSLVMTTSCW